MESVSWSYRTLPGNLLLLCDIDFSVLISLCLPEWWMLKHPCLTVFFLRTVLYWLLLVFGNFLWYVSTLRIVLCLFVSWCVILFRNKFPLFTYFYFLLGFTVTDHTSFIVQWERMEPRFILSVQIDTFPSTIGWHSRLLCDMCVVFCWHSQHVANACPYLLWVLSSFFWGGRGIKF